MQMAPYVQALQEDLANAASLAADEAAQEAGRRLAQALEPSLQLRLLDLLSEIALSLNSQVPGRVEVRLAGREPELVYVEEEEAEPRRSLRRRAHRPDHAPHLRLAQGADRACRRAREPFRQLVDRARSRGLETRSVRAVAPDRLRRELKGAQMSRLHPISYGAGVLLVPDYCAPQIPVHDDRVVIPTRRRRRKRDA